MGQSFHIEGMKCMGCVSTVRDALENLDGVQVLEVSLETASARIEGDVSSADVCAILKDAGYPATPVD